METIQTLIPLAIAISLGGLVLAVGLDTDLDDVLYMVRRPLLLLKAVLAVNVIVPAAAVAVLALMPGVAILTKVGILLMAASPVPPLVPGQQQKVSARKAYSRGLYAAMVVLTLITLPLAVAALGRFYGATVEMPMQKVAFSIAVTVLAPLVIGLVIHRLAPALAARASGLLSRLSMILLLVAALPVLFAAWPAISALAGDGSYVAMLLVVVVALAAGHLLGGPDPQDRASLAVTAAIRHPGLAIAVAGANSADRQITATILAFVLVQCATAAVYGMVLKRRSPRAATA